MNDSDPTRLEGILELRKLGLVIDNDAHDDAPFEYCREVPVDPHAGPDADVDLGVRYGFAPIADRAVRRCRNALLESLIDAFGEGAFDVFYSRDNNDYAKYRDQRPDYWTRRNVKAAVTSLEVHPDLVISRRVAPQNPYSPDFIARRSTLAVGPVLITQLAPVADGAAAKAVNRVILRDAKGRQKQVAADDPVVVRTATLFERYDELLTRTHFEIRSGVQWQSSSIGVVQVKGGLRYIRLRDFRAVRIFNRTLTRGGRLYRTWWLNLPKALRASIHINGEPIVEHDYRACHFRLAYAGILQVAAPHLPNDPYSLPEHLPEMRPIVKTAVQILFNAKTYRGALGAIAAGDGVGAMCGGDDWEARLDLAKDVIARIKSTYPEMAPLWHSGCGSALQFIDSEIVMACLAKLVARGIVALGVHDSIIVTLQHQETLIKIMEETFDEIGPAMARRHLKYFRDEFARKQRKGAKSYSGATDSALDGATATLAHAPGDETDRSDAIALPPSDQKAGGCSGLHDLVLTKWEKKQPQPGTGSTSKGRTDGEGGLSPLFFADADHRAPSLPRSQCGSSTSRVEIVILDRIRRPLDVAFHADLLTLIKDRRRITPYMLRALLLDRTNYGLAVDTAAEFLRHWLGDTWPITRVAHVPGELQSEIDRLRARRPLPLSLPSAAKLCGARKRDVVRLGLHVLVPRRGGKTPARMISHKAALTNGKVSRVVNVKRAAPWGSGSRSSWFEAVKSPVDRQRMALAAMIEVGDAQGVISAYGRYAERVAARDLINDKNRIAADALFDALAPLFNSTKGKELMAEADTADPERITGSESSACNSVQTAADQPAATAAISEGFAAAPQAVRQPEDVPVPDAPDTGDADHKAPSAPAARKGFLARLVGFGSGKSEGQQ